MTSQPALGPILGARVLAEFGDDHAALRQLGNQLVGILHGCLKTRTHYDEPTAWPAITAAAA